MNYFMLRIKDMERTLENEVAVQRMVVSFPPLGTFQLSLLQRFVLRYLRPFLGSMADFEDEERSRADVESDEFDTEEDSDELAEGRNELQNSELTLPEGMGEVENSKYSY